MAEVLSFPGCHTQGATKAEAMANIREAIELFIETLQDSGCDVPDDQAIEIHGV